MPSGPISLLPVQFSRRRRTLDGRAGSDCNPRPNKANVTPGPIGRPPRYGKIVIGWTARALRTRPNSATRSMPSSDSSPIRRTIPSFAWKQTPRPPGREGRPSQPETREARPRPGLAFGDLRRHSASRLRACRGGSGPGPRARVIRHRGGLYGEAGRSVAMTRLANWSSTSLLTFDASAPIWTTRPRPSGSTKRKSCWVNFQTAP